MKLQKVTIKLESYYAAIYPDALCKLMALDEYCLPIYESTKCTLYFQKCLSKKQISALNSLPYFGATVKFSNTLDNPCLKKNGHKNGVYVYSLDTVTKITGRFL